MILRAIADLPFKSDDLQYIYFKDERGEKECGRAVIQAEWKDQRLKIEINEVLPSDKSKTNDPGYLLSNRPWNKTSGRDIITNTLFLSIYTLRHTVTATNTHSIQLSNVVIIQMV